jgi:hypothetical protein
VTEISELEKNIRTKLINTLEGLKSLNISIQEFEKRRNELTLTLKICQEFLREKNVKEIEIPEANDNTEQVISLGHLIRRIEKVIAGHEGRYQTLAQIRDELYSTYPEYAKDSAIKISVYKGLLVILENYVDDPPYWLSVAQNVDGVYAYAAKPVKDLSNKENS